MTTLTIKATAVCAGGNHVTMRPSIDAVAKPSVVMNVDDMTSAVTDDDVLAVMKVLIRLYSNGRTKAQVKTGLQTGIDITIP